MFAKVKGKDKKTLVELLAFIVAGTQGPSGHALVPKSLADQIQKYEPSFIKIQGDPDPGGNVAVFATSSGIQASSGTASDSASGTPAASSTKPQFVLETGFAVPESKRGGLKGDTYPFAAMEVGMSFFVPATEDNPNPAKSLASTVSSANKRYVATFPLTVGKAKTAHPKAGQPTGQDGRKFTVRARTVQDGEKANGARIYRIA